MEDEEIKHFWGKVFKIGIGLIVVIMLFGMLINPLLKPWWASQSGKAELAQAEQNRQIAILEATAKRDSAVQLAQAEIERAKGVAESNKIISSSINEQYLKYLWITEISADEHDKTVVYVPTEANIPILEAGRTPQ